MSKLYIRNRPAYICFLHNKQELLEFVESYLPGRVLLIGDLAQFNSSMRQVLLKFIEENPAVNCYSSEDIVDGTLLSRFLEVIKDPTVIDAHTSIDEFLTTSRDYNSVQLCLSSYNGETKLRAPLCSNSLLKLLLK